VGFARYSLYKDNVARPAEDGGSSACLINIARRHGVNNIGSLNLIIWKRPRSTAAFCRRYAMICKRHAPSTNVRTTPSWSPDERPFIASVNLKHQVRINWRQNSAIYQRHISCDCLADHTDICAHVYQGGSVPALMVTL